ncbi:hypothetical protein H4R34_000945 [Dimargaris verticillata]|uniref:Uncharacterized protein n=1 Tax=Dimargaris verticillata TaxID=2761393 RepID=A0A9W8BCC5_9FUNG|nr:hypothetical protein H4R34_000945 [Dimargaris verticillata]
MSSGCIRHWYSGTAACAVSKRQILRDRQSRRHRPKPYKSTDPFATFQTTYFEIQLDPDYRPPLQSPFSSTPALFQPLDPQLAEIPAKISDATTAQHLWTAYRKYREINAQRMPDGNYYRRIVTLLSDFHRQLLDQQNVEQYGPFDSGESSMKKPLAKPHPRHRSKHEPSHRAPPPPILESARRITTFCNHWLVLAQKAQQVYDLQQDPTTRYLRESFLLLLPSPDDLALMSRALCCADQPHAALNVAMQTKQWFKVPTPAVVGPILAYFATTSDLDNLRKLRTQLFRWQVVYTREIAHPILECLAKHNEFQDFEATVEFCHRQLTLGIAASVLAKAAQSFARASNATAIDYLYELITYQWAEMSHADYLRWFRALKLMRRADLACTLVHQLCYEKKTCSGRQPLSLELYEAMVAALFRGQQPEYYQEICRLHRHLQSEGEGPSSLNGTCSGGGAGWYPLQYRYTPHLFWQLLHAYSQCNNRTGTLQIYTAGRHLHEYTNPGTVHTIVADLVQVNLLDEAVAFLQNQVPRAVPVKGNTFLAIITAVTATAGMHNHLLPLIRSNMRLRRVAFDPPMTVTNQVT